MVEKSGAWYSYNGERIGQGRKNAADFLDDHPELKEEIEARIRQLLMPALGEGGDNVEALAGDAGESGLGEPGAILVSPVRSLVRLKGRAGLDSKDAGNQAKCYAAAVRLPGNKGSTVSP